MTTNWGVFSSFSLSPLICHQSGSKYELKRGRHGVEFPWDEQSPHTWCWSGWHFHTLPLSPGKFWFSFLLRLLLTKLFSSSFLILSLGF
jgi:hypothetical protein